MIQITEYNQIESINELREEWQSLLLKTPCASFFQTPEWLETYWRYYSGNQKLRIFVATDNHRIVGILPLVIRTVSTILGKIRLLTYPLDDWGDFYGPIGEDRDLVLYAVCKYLKNCAHRWDIFEPRWVNDGGEEYGETFSAMQNSGMSPLPSPWSSVSQICFEGDIEDYWERWESKDLSEQRRNERRLDRKGLLEYVRYRSESGGDPKWDLFENCCQVAQSSWQGSSATGTTLSHQSIQGFLKDLHAIASNMGCVDLNLLFLDKKPVAFAYGYCLQGNVDGCRIGFVRSKQTNGAGRVLIARMIESGFQLKDQTLNMGSEKYGWKKLWQTNSVTTYRQTCFSSRSMSAQILKTNRWLKSRLNSAHSVLNFARKSNSELAERNSGKPNHKVKSSQERGIS